MNQLRTVVAVLCAACAVVALPVRGADYPTRSVRIVLPYATGGGGDIMTRVLAEKLAEAWGQPVIVDNKPGAGATIGSDIVAKAAPDGYTLLMTAGTIAVSPAAYAKLPYDVVRDFAPIVTVARAPYFLVVHPGVPANSFAEFLRLARSQPGKINIGSAGNGTLAHLCIELLKATAGVDVVHVPYKGSSLAFNDLLGGQVSAVFDTPAAVKPFVTSRKVRPLGVTTPVRSKSLPDVPTLVESGVPGYDVSVWFGLLAPAGTSREVIAAVQSTVTKVLGNPAVAARFDEQGFESFTLGPADFAGLIRTDIAKWSGVIRKAGIKFD